MSKKKKKNDEVINFGDPDTKNWEKQCMICGESPTVIVKRGELTIDEMADKFKTELEKVIED